MDAKKSVKKVEKSKNMRRVEEKKEREKEGEERIFYRECKIYSLAWRKKRRNWRRKMIHVGRKGRKGG